MPNIRTKISLFGYIWVRIFKKPIFSFLFSNQHAQLCLIRKFCENTKMSKFRSKNVLSRCF